MAKLSARGRTKVHQVINAAGDVRSALMSDGAVLHKFKLSDGKWTGWTLRGKLREGFTPDAWLNIRLKGGYKKEEI